MVANVDAPPISRMPPKLSNDPELREYFIQNESLIYQLWVRTGGFNDDISDTGKRELYPFPNLHSEIEQQRVNAQVLSTNYTTTGNQILIATANITITLNSTPGDLERVTIKHAAPNRVDVSGSIDGASSYAMLAKYESLTFIYSVDQSEWYIV